MSERETPTNSYSKSSVKNNCPCIFSANSSLCVFSKSWQYYFNAKRLFVLAQAVSKSGPNTLKNKSGLLAMMAPWRTFNIHGAFPLHKRFFIKQFFRLLKCSLRKSGSFKNCLLKGSLGNPKKWFSFGITTTNPPPLILRVDGNKM